MLKKWLCLMLAAQLLFASCASGDKPGDSGQTAGGTEQNTPADGGEDAVPETEAPETEDPATIFDLEVKNFDGKTVGILGTNWYNIASNWTSPELKVTELTGEAMNDAVYTRNLNMESKYNISFNVVDGGAYLDGTIKNDYLAGTATYDIAFPRISEMNNVAQALFRAYGNRVGQEDVPLESCRLLAADGL